MEALSFWSKHCKRVTIALLFLVNLSFVNYEHNHTYKAYDDYQNMVFTLVLHKDNTYAFEEKFLDGSVCKDEGTWTQAGEQLCLKSAKKSKREHNYLKFKKAIKFKGDTFRMVDDTLVYEGKGNSKMNSHFKNLLIVKTNKAPQAVGVAVE